MKKLTLLFILLISHNAFSQAIFKQFDSWAEAANFYTFELDPLMAGIEGREPYKVLPHTHSSYKKIENFIDKLHSAFRDLFPKQVTFKKAPNIIILLTAEQNAHVVSDPNSTIKPYLFAIHRGLLLLPDEVVIGILAHELTHLYLQWEENGEDIPKEKYFISSNQLKFGPNIINDLAIANKVKLREELRSYAGPFSHEELGGIPLIYDYAEISPYREILYLLENAPESDICLKADKNNEDFLHNMLENFFSYTSFELTLNSESAAKTVSKEAEFVELLLKDCLNKVNYDYKELLNKVYGISLDTINSLYEKMSMFEKEVFDDVESHYGETSAIEAIFNVTRKYRKRVRTLEEETSFKKVRIYTHEDHADEVAVEVLNHIGMNPDGLNRFLIDEFSEDETIDCDYKNIESEPFYGPLEDIHHASCWRAFRNHQYFLKLSVE